MCICIVPMNNDFNLYSAAMDVIAPEYQWILITISVLVVIAALVFAGYIIIRNDKQRMMGGHPRAEDEESSLDNINDLKKKIAAMRPEKDAVTENTIHLNTMATIPLLISELRVAPGEAGLGEKVTISFRATNLDKSCSHYDIILKIDNRVFATKEVSIARGSTLPVNYAIYSTVPGEHRVDVNDVVSKFVII